MIRQICLALGLSALLMSCQSNEIDPMEERARLLAMKPAIDSVPSSGLGPQELLAGECGLFLWSQTDVSKFIFFSKALSGTAVFAQGEEPITLTQVTAGGDIFGQFNTDMFYFTEDGRELSLTMTPGDLLDGGQRIERGLITIRDREGWDTKLPVLGVRACQQE
nr:hypothetical protein [Hyphomonas sp. Mor2]